VVRIPDPAMSGDDREVHTCRGQRFLKDAVIWCGAQATPEGPHLVPMSVLPCAKLSVRTSRAIETGVAPLVCSLMWVSPMSHVGPLTTNQVQRASEKGSLASLAHSQRLVGRPPLQPTAKCAPAEVALLSPRTVLEVRIFMPNQPCTKENALTRAAIASQRETSQGLARPPVRVGRLLAHREAVQRPSPFLQGSTQTVAHRQRPFQRERSPVPLHHQW